MPYSIVNLCAFDKRSIKSVLLTYLSYAPPSVDDADFWLSIPMFQSHMSAHSGHNFCLNDDDDNDQIKLLYCIPDFVDIKMKEQTVENMMR